MIRVVFLHVPKTAGMSLKKSLSRRPGVALFGAGHVGYGAARAQWLREGIARKKRYRNRLGVMNAATWESAFKFGFVRNPWDRCLSLYLYDIARRRLRKHKDPGPPTRDGFSSWLPAQPLITTATPAKMLEGDVDYIGRFEQLAESVAELQALLGLEPRPLPHENASGATQIRAVAEWYDDRSRAYVAKRGAWEVERFGYSSWELDALEPSVISDLIGDEIEGLIDHDLMDARKEDQEAQRKKLEDVAAEWEYEAEDSE